MLTERSTRSAEPGPADAASDLAAAVSAELGAGRRDAARERYADLVVLLQRRASRLACYYLRDGADADEAVQDAFVKAFTHMGSYAVGQPFEPWFQRILVNGCLDRLKARGRRARWMVPLASDDGAMVPGREPADTARDAESMLLGKETRAALRRAIGALPDRQRTVVVLGHLDGRTTREVSELTGLTESTIRVHLFRAMRRLRTLLEQAAGGTHHR